MFLSLHDHFSPCEEWSDNCKTYIHSCIRVCACVFVCVNSKMMDVCGEAENRLASELMQHEVQIERDILDPLNQLAEVKHRHCRPLHTVRWKVVFVATNFFN